MDECVIEASGVSKIYAASGVACVALNNVSLCIERGGFVAIAGPSGSGKTTLLNIVSGLDVATAGRVVLAGKELGRGRRSAEASFRRDHVGFVFQSYNLIPVLNVSENVEYVLMLQNVAAAERKRRVGEALAEVGIAGFEKRFPAELSGGQQQRVAVARALVSKPDIIFADEPTANLDSKTAEALVKTLEHLNVEHGVSILFSTHDALVMKRARRVITLRDGAIWADEVAATER